MSLVMCTFQNCQKGVVLKRKKSDFFSAESSNLTTESGSILCAVKTIVLQGRDVGNCSDDSYAMEDKAKNKRRGNYCVASGPNMASCESNSLTPGVTMHYFPKDEIDGRRGLSLSEFTGKISSHRSQRRYALYTSTKSVSKARLFCLLLPKVVRPFTRRGTWLKVLYLQETQLFFQLSSQFSEAPSGK